MDSSGAFRGGSLLTGCGLERVACLHRPPPPLGRSGTERGAAYRDLFSPSCSPAWKFYWTPVDGGERSPCCCYTSSSWTQQVSVYHQPRSLVNEIIFINVPSHVRVPSRAARLFCAMFHTIMASLVILKLIFFFLTIRLLYTNWTWKSLFFFQAVRE